LLALALTAGCTATNVARYPDSPQGLSPVPTDSVRVYSDTSEMCGYERIADLQVSGSMDGMQEETRKEAIKKTAELGGNALLLGKTINQNPNASDFAGQTVAGFSALLEDRPCNR
jgi:hypothetical protein